MRLVLSGADIPEDVCNIVASLTDGARLRYGEVRHDSASGEVCLPMTRYPLVKKRSVLHNVRDTGNPIPTLLTVRNVIACDIEDSTPSGFGQEVQLIFGVQIEGEQVYACSAEEDRGQPLYSITLQTSTTGVEIADAADCGAG